MKTIYVSVGSVIPSILLQKGSNINIITDGPAMVGDVIQQFNNKCLSGTITTIHEQRPAEGNWDYPSFKNMNPTFNRVTIEAFK